MRFLGHEKSIFCIWYLATILVPGDFVRPGPFHMSTSSYDYKDTSAVNIESPVTSVVNCEGLKADKCINAVNIDGHEEEKWIVVRSKKNGSTINYLLETE